MKRIIALLLLVVLATSMLFTACTTNAPNAESSNHPNTEASLPSTESPDHSDPAESTEAPDDSGYVNPEDWSDDWASRPIPSSFDLRSVDTDGDGVGGPLLRNAGKASESIRYVLGLCRNCGRGDQSFGLRL